MIIPCVSDDWTKVPNKKGIYLIINTVNKKAYVGRAKNLREKFKQQHKYFNNCMHYNKYINEDLRVFTPDCFVFIVVETSQCDLVISELKYLWTQLLKSFEPEYGYNLDAYPKHDYGRHNHTLNLKALCEVLNVMRTQKTAVSA